MSRRKFLHLTWIRSERLMIESAELLLVFCCVKFIAVALNNRLSDQAHSLLIVLLVVCTLAA
jgi:hypothetical protein